MKFILYATLAGLGIAFTIFSEEAMASQPGSVTLEWYGHSCFLLTLENGAKILTDPYDTTRIPYQLPEESVDLIFSTHDHFDHNAVDLVPSRTILRANGREPTFRVTKNGTELKGEEESPSIDLDGKAFRCSTVPSFHDDRGGALRGANGIIRFTVEGITFVHLGDLGEMLDSAQIKQLKPVDVLMVPVGGYYTIDAEVAKQVVAALSPRIVIPMHYKTAVLSAGFPIEGVAPFLEGYDHVNRRASSSIRIRADQLPEELTIEVLKYHGQD